MRRRPPRRDRGPPPRDKDKALPRAKGRRRPDRVAADLVAPVRQRDEAERAEDEAAAGRRSHPPLAQKT
jgi:hypothetical protein